MNFDRIPEGKNEKPFLPFDSEYEEERALVAREYGVASGQVDKREDGLWYVNGRRILPKDTFSGLSEDDEANPYKKSGAH